MRICLCSGSVLKHRTPLLCSSSVDLKEAVVAAVDIAAVLAGLGVLSLSVLATYKLPEIVVEGRMQRSPPEPAALPLPAIRAVV